MRSFSESLATAAGLLTGLDPALLAIVGRSLAVSATACALGGTAGLLLGTWLGVSREADLFVKGELG